MESSGCSLANIAGHDALSPSTTSRGHAFGLPFCSVLRLIGPSAGTSGKQRRRGEGSQPGGAGTE